MKVYQYVNFNSFKQFLGLGDGPLFKKTNEYDPETNAKVNATYKEWGMRDIRNVANKTGKSIPELISLYRQGPSLDDAVTLKRMTPLKATLQDPDVGTINIGDASVLGTSARASDKLINIHGLSAASNAINNLPDKWKTSSTLENSILRHEKKHIIDDTTNPSMKYIRDLGDALENPTLSEESKDSIKKKMNTPSGVIDLANAHTEFKVQNGKIIPNRASIAERRADSYALKGKSLRDYIQYIAYLNAANEDNIKPLQDSLNKTYDKLNAKSQSDGKIDYVKQFDRQMAQNADSHVSGQLESARTGKFYADQAEPQRVKSLIRQYMNDATKTSSNPELAKATIAKQLAESGVLSPQLTNNMLGLADNYNKTGQWFGYFSKTCR